MKSFCLILLLFVGLNPIVAQHVLKIDGLHEAVEVIRDRYGINHIYAKNEHDLFFAQGYCAAKDRLFQFEVWRRQATGTVAEILGPREVTRDIGARLFSFRGNLTQELNHYHPHGAAIVSAFTNGINAYIHEVLQNPKELPLEFTLLNIRPGFWTPEVVISRHQGLLGNIGEEISNARLVATIGAAKLKELDTFEPGDPRLELDSVIRKERLFDPVLELYDAFRKPITFTPDDLVASAYKNTLNYASLVQADEIHHKELLSIDRQVIGSNNWIVSGTHTQSGFPILANDPHRALSAPSLRYMVHLHAPGWNVVGGGEPTIPGVSIGHNEYGAWGLTIFSIDAEDLYVYELNPAQPLQYKYHGQWESMRIIADTIHVKGAPDVIVQHKYTRHGPVTFMDPRNNIAYALRGGWMEVGGAPYLASLRIDQAKSWGEFRDACRYSHIPGENMIWADKQGNIGWQAVGIAPIRTNWDGLVPVPGDGRYEWGGYLPVLSLPHVLNPEKGFWATANENLIPPHYEHRHAVGWSWADSFRADRVNEVLATGTKHSLADMMRLQHDYLSIPARTIIPLLNDLNSADSRTEAARQLLTHWNFILDKNSIEATLHVAWEKQLNKNMTRLLVPEEALKYLNSIPTSKMIDGLITIRPEFGTDGVAGRNQFLLTSLQQAVADLTQKWGSDMKKWTYGRTHYALIKHPLSNVVNESTRKKLEVGPLPRGGYSFTPGMTTHNENQNAGATFRLVVDLKDWDHCMFTNAPGQSGDIKSPFYRNLFPLWASDQHFPVYFTREKIEEMPFEKITLSPVK